MKTIECKEKGCDQTREASKIIKTTIMLCDEHFAIRRRQQTKRLMRRHRTDKKRRKSPTLTYVRVECKKCDGHRMVSVGWAHRCLPLCPKHATEHTKKKVQARINTVKKVEKPPRLGLKVASGGGLFYGRVLPDKDIMQTLEDGYYPDDIVFEDTESKERYTVERVGDSQKLVEV